jgi:hypothetical protein
MNYYLKSEFLVETDLKPQEQEKPTRQEMLKMAISDVNKKNKKILENPFNQGSSNISDKQLQESKKEINQLNKEGEALSRKYRTDHSKLLLPTPKKDLSKQEQAKQKSNDFSDNDSKSNPVNVNNLYFSKSSLSSDKYREFGKQSTESNNNVLLIMGVCLSLISIMIFFIWKKNLLNRMIVLKNLMIQKFKFYKSKKAKKAFNLLSFIWILFHLFMFLTSYNIVDYNISWEDFWFFNEWENYKSDVDGIHYDISEFIIYVIIPLIIIFGRKYLKGERFFNSGLITVNNKTSNIDAQISDLKKYKELFDLGVISEDEFVEFKKKLINK